MVCVRASAKRIQFAAVITIVGPLFLVEIINFVIRPSRRRQQSSSYLHNMLHPKFAYSSDSMVRCLAESFDCHKNILRSKWLHRILKPRLLDSLQISLHFALCEVQWQLGPCAISNYTKSCRVYTRHIYPR